MKTFNQFNESNNKAQSRWESQAGIKFGSKSEQTIFRSAYSNPDIAEHEIRKMGYTSAGEGYFSVVFKKSGSKNVIKLNLIRDKCWLQFAELAMKDSNSKHSPRIPWMKVYGEEKKFFIVAMEPLLSLENHNNLKLIKNKNDLCALAMDVDLHDTELGIVLERYAALHLYRKIQYPKHEEIIQESLQNYVVSSAYVSSSIAKAFVKMRKFRGTCFNDLHLGNVMLRQRDNNLVITDPWA